MLLARRSHDVALVHPASHPASSLAESIPPSARRLFSELGITEAMDGAGFMRNGGNIVWWAGAEKRSESFSAGEGGFHVDRAGLEAVLIAQAEAVGVHVYAGLSARSANEAADGWTIHCDGPAAHKAVLNAPWLLDATGRHGFLARQQGRDDDRSTTTLALIRRWRSPRGWPGDDALHTLVESYEDGWVWSVPLSEDTRCFTAMVDQRAAGLEGHDVARMLDVELSKTSHIGPMTEGAEALGDAWACPASLYCASSFGRVGSLLVGDAGSSIDPLSSFGVKKALSAGWLAGVVVHTALVDPAMTGTAISFFDAREREVYQRLRGISADFFEAAAVAHGTAYWIDRAAAAKLAAGPVLSAARHDPDHVGAPTVPESDVRAAFEEIRTHEHLSAVRSETLRTIERPGIDGHRIVLQDHLANDSWPGGMRYSRGVDLRQLVEIAQRHASVPDGWTAYNAAAPSVTLPDYLTALATAFAAGFLEHGDA